MSASQEAIAHYGKALELLKALPESPERVEKELSLQAPLAVALMKLRGYADPKVGEAYRRAHELGKQIGATPQIAPVLFGLLSFYFIGAEYKTELKIIEEVHRRAQKVNESSPLFLLSHFSKVGYFHMLGEYKDCLKHAEQAIAVYDPSKHRSLIFEFGQDINGMGLCWASSSLWFLGFPDKSRERAHQSLSFARDLNHPFTLSLALFFIARILHFHREMQTVQELTEELGTLSTTYGFIHWLGIASTYEGRLLVEQGRMEEGIEQIRRGISMIRATGARLFDHHNLTILAEALGKAGQVEEGLVVVEEGLALGEKTGGKCYDAELHRLNGELLLTQGRNEETVEGHFQKSIEVARRQSARSLELRATMSLARLWQKQGKKEEARKRLEEIYGWFTEGFGTPDLKDAKALLDALSV